MFESAYFVIRPEKERVDTAEEKDMVSEAMRIINETENDASANKKKLRRAVFGDVMKFFAGFICGVGIAVLLVLVFHI